MTTLHSSDLPFQARSLRSWWPWLSIPCTLGALLRLWNIQHQVLAGDEAHALRTALAQTLPEILTRFQTADACIPISAFDRLLLAAGVPLDEGWIRLPNLLGDLALLFLMPVLVAPRIGRFGALAYAWLLALSPVLWSYSRLARPYSLLVLLTALAGLCFDRWLRASGAAAGPSLRSTGATVLAAGLALWFHLCAVPLVAGMFLAGALEVFLAPSSERRRRWTRLLGLGSMITALVALLLGAAVPSLFQNFQHYPARIPVPLSTIGRVLVLQAGVDRGWYALLFFGFAAFGFVCLWRRERSWARFTLVVVAAQWIGILLLDPPALAEPLILNRYALPTLPWVFAWVVAGLAALGRRRHGALAVAALLLALVLAGPWRDGERLRTSFAQHNDFVDFSRPRAVMPAQAVPAFYRDLAEKDDGCSLFEAPWPPQWGLQRLPYVYQCLHQRPVVVGLLSDWIDDPRIRLNSTRPPTLEAALASGARYLVVHRDPLEEERLVTRAGRPDPPAVIGGEEQRLGVLAGRASRLIHDATARFGAPWYTDAFLEVWDLEAERSPERKQ